MVDAYQWRRTPVKLSLSRCMVAAGQTPMGMKVSKYLRMWSPNRYRPKTPNADRKSHHRSLFLALGW